MSQGKQLSFANGAVSPKQRFKASSLTYQQGLTTLKNMFVRTDGGVSNRAGLRLIEICQTQSGIPEVGGNPGIKSFVVWDYISASWRTITYAKFTGSRPLHDWEVGYPGTYNFPDGYGISIDGTVIGSSDYDFYNTPVPADVRFVPLKDKVLITPQVDDLSTGIGGEFSHNVAVSFDPDFIGFAASLCPEGGYSSVISGATTFSFQAVTPYLPVSYLVMAVLKDGREVLISSYATGGYVSTTVAPASGPVHPHAQLSLTMTFNLTMALPDVKFFNYYRGAGANGLGKTFYRLCGRVPYDGALTAISFTDYGAEAPALTPPIDKSFLGMSAITGERFLVGAKVAAYYQQRLIVAIESGREVDPIMRPGEYVASKLGATDEMKAPIISEDTGAFQFSIPITDGTEPVAALSMERLLSFHERGVFIIRGGEQGLLTPGSVNPLRISEEGCSRTVEPKMAGTRGYYMNATHTKLMAIEFGLDGNVKVYEASQFSRHLLNHEVIQLEVLTINGEDNAVFLLRRDGKLVQVTLLEDGTHGFAEVETDGYVESIYSGKALKVHVPNVLEGPGVYHDVLMAYVIRNGIRTVEQVVVREDRHREGEFFADCHVRVGWRLKYLNSTLGYDRIDSSGNSYGGPINLTTATTWLAGQTITLTMDTSEEPTFEQDGVIHLFYGNGQAIRFIPDWTTVVEIPNVLTVEGYLEVDVPAELQDVDSQAITAEEKILRKTNWLSAFNQFPLFTYDGQILEADTALSVVMDGEILSSPLNPNRSGTILYPTLQTGQWVIQLDDYYSWGYVGLPYTSEFETLDIETADNRTLTDSKKLFNGVGVGFYETRGGFIGMPDRELEEMEELVFRTDGDITTQTSNKNGYHSVIIPSEWTEAGRINIQNVDPVPMTILSVYPKGLAGD